MHQNGLGAALFEQRAADSAHRGYAILTVLRPFDKSPGDSTRSLDYPDSLLQQSFEEFLSFVH